MRRWITMPMASSTSQSWKRCLTSGMMGSSLHVLHPLQQQQQALSSQQLRTITSWSYQPSSSLMSFCWQSHGRYRYHHHMLSMTRSSIHTASPSSTIGPHGDASSPSSIVRCEWSGNITSIWQTNELGRMLSAYATSGDTFCLYGYVSHHHCTPLTPTSL
jgi:hypothetical protein